MPKIEFSKRAIKDLNLIKQAKLESKVGKLLQIIGSNPFQNPPPYEKLSGYLNRYSRRINYQHRLVYTICDDTIKINSMWTHYE